MGTHRTAQYWKEQLQLTQHVEGGAFREIYRSDISLPKKTLTAAHKGARNACTSIYFLLEYGEFSALHRIASDEIWHHYDGAALCIYEITADGMLTKHLLGKDLENGEMPQVIIPAGSWFGSRVEISGAFTLCGCTVSPGFDFEDFELANRDMFSQQYPQHEHLIKSLT